MLVSPTCTSVSKLAMLPKSVDVVARLSNCVLFRTDSTLRDTDDLMSTALDGSGEEVFTVTGDATMQVPIEPPQTPAEQEVGLDSAVSRHA